MSESPELKTDIDREHQAIESTLDRLGTAPDPGSQGKALARLRSQLEAHFAREEAADGLLSAIEDQAVNLVPQVEGLFVEHDELRAAVRELHERCERLAREQAEAEQRIHALIEQLRNHEMRENRLFTRAVYREYGAGD